MAEPLDPLTLPLRGSRLIEASAGTGKTWTIAALYVRLVLGHAAAAPPHEPATAVGRSTSGGLQASDSGPGEALNRLAGVAAARAGRPGRRLDTGAGEGAVRGDGSGSGIGAGNGPAPDVDGHRDIDTVGDAGAGADAGARAGAGDDTGAVSAAAASAGAASAEVRVDADTGAFADARPDDHDDADAGAEPGPGGGPSARRERGPRRGSGLGPGAFPARDDAHPADAAGRGRHGLDAPVPPLRALLPGEILVMTFTKAATRELSDRIRRRLVEAAACFRGDTAPPPGDGFLAALLDAHPPGPARQRAVWLLATAAESMDDAAVHTIDAWCQRMLREHAFDSGCLFDEELQADEAAMRAEAARDYWRQQVYPLSPTSLAVVLAVWKDVDALAADAGRLIGKPLPPQAGAGSLGACIDTATGGRAQRLADLKRRCADHAAPMRGWLDAQLARADKPFDGVKLRRANVHAWIDEVEAWARDAGRDDLTLSDAARRRLTPAGLREAARPGASLDAPGCFAAFEALLAEVAALPGVGPALRAHAAARVAERLLQIKSQAGAFGFADMLDRLDAALDPALNPGTAERLRQRILADHPVALVDEFQDTSPVQLRILDRLYGVGDDAPGRALLLIGDPKQSIYAFRGADLHSYLRARVATAGRHHVLGTNHRSTPALVSVVNALFAGAEKRAGDGAFMYRGAGAGGGVARDAAPGGAVDDPLPYVPTTARGRAERLVVGGVEPAAMTLDVDPVLRGMPDSRARHAERCAERIVALLNDASAGFVAADPGAAAPGDAAPVHAAHGDAGTGAGGPSAGGFKRLRPADIAVLVRTGAEAAEVRRALRRRGVASVYLSDQDSVFAGAEAGDLLRLLQAVAAPRDVRRVRAALATSLVGLAIDDLVALATDDERFDAECERFAALQQAWQAQGVLAMVRRALHAHGLPARWLAGVDGERRLTNVLHLAELLQAASARLEGEQALVRWLSQQIDAAGRAGPAARGGAADEHVLRLESDADLVQVVTVHKSKGLEYPLVFVPYAAHYRAVTRGTASEVLLSDAAAAAPDGGGRSPRLVLAPTDDDLAAADRDRQREDLRLLYVALTRARHAVWVGVAALRVGQVTACVWHRSGIGHLLSGPGPVGSEGVVEAVQRFAGAVAGCAVETAVDPGGDDPRTWPATPLRRDAAAPALRPAPEYTAAFDRSWTIASYSALVRDAQRTATPAAASGDVPARTLRDDDEPLPPQAPDTPEPARAPTSAPWHRFPRGALAGNFLHAQLEWLAGEGFAALGASPALQQALRRRCERQGHGGSRADDVVAWLVRLCDTPLPPLGTPLAGLDRVLPEMEFWFPSDGLHARAVDDLCRRHLFPGRPRPALPERALHGMLMGFIDLGFEHAGRWGVLDYKSNALGPRDADYTPAAMQAAVLEHRYDVQAALYLLALHRLLRRRLGTAYRPGTHLHGAVVLFLRGVNSEGAGALHVPGPAALIEGLDAMLAPAVPDDGARGA